MAAPNPPPIASDFTTAAGLRLHYRSAGSGEPVLLVHGWPASSHLWRDVIPPIARTHRVVAIDLPGFGRSDKPLDLRYEYDDYDRILDAFLDALELPAVNLVVHDLGGPVGLLWAVRHPHRVLRLAMCNTLVYPELSGAAIAFLVAMRLPLLRTYLSSPRGIAAAMRLGVADKGRMRRKQIEPYQAPFTRPDARKALIRSVTSLGRAGLVEIAAGLGRLDIPVRIVYGTEDRILPDVAKTMRRVAGDLPQAEVTALEGCGHFLQEERPEEVGEILAAFVNGPLQIRAAG